MSQRMPTPSIPSTRGPGYGLSPNLHHLETSATIAISQEAKRRKAAGEVVIDLGAGEPDFPTPPIPADAGVRAIRETDGVVIDVSDAEILEAKAVIDASGVGCEPASAASVAGVRKLAREGTISAGDRVVAVLTGHILKDPGILLDYHKDAKRPLANTPIEIDAEVGAVERVLTEAASTWRQR